MTMSKEILCEGNSSKGKVELSVQQTTVAVSWFGVSCVGEVEGVVW